MKSYRFKRYRFSKDGMEEQAVSITLDQEFTENDGEKELKLAYKTLFQKYPNWGTGKPTKKGIGWSSAVMGF